MNTYDVEFKVTFRLESSNSEAATEAVLGMMESIWGEMVVSEEEHKIRIATLETERGARYELVATHKVLTPGPRAMS